VPELPPPEPPPLEAPPAEASPQSIGVGGEPHATASTKATIPITPKRAPKLAPVAPENIFSALIIFAALRGFGASVNGLRNRLRICARASPMPGRIDDVEHAIAADGGRRIERLGRVTPRYTPCRHYFAGCGIEPLVVHRSPGRATQVHRERAAAGRIYQDLGATRGRLRETVRRRAQSGARQHRVEVEPARIRQDVSQIVPKVIPSGVRRRARPMHRR
jgi:hypothetical protein